MVLVVTVTKQGVTQVMNDLWNVTLNMTLTDDSAEVVNKDYSLHYRPGDSLGDRRDAWIAMMQADIDEYKSEQEIFDMMAFTIVSGMVEDALVV